MTGAVCPLVDFISFNVSILSICLAVKLSYKTDQHTTASVPMYIYISVIPEM